MKTINLALSLLLFSSTVFAVDLEQRAAQAYEATKSKAQIVCDNSYLPQLKSYGPKLLINDRITAEFSIEDLNFDIVSDVSGMTYLLGAGVKIPASKVSKTGQKITFQFANIDEASKEIVKKYNLRALRCDIRLAVDGPFEVKQNRIHINVHPHTVFDWNDYTTDTINEYFTKSDMQQVLLLHEKSPHERTGKTKVTDFIQQINITMAKLAYGLKLGDIIIDDSVPLIVSGTGHNEFILDDGDLEVFYTGGNHNWCIMNNAGHLLDAFISGIDSKLTINYVVSGIVLQRTGRTSRTFNSGPLSIGRWFMRKNGNYLKNVLEKLSNSDLRNYHWGYFQYFVSHLKKRKKLFETIDIIYNGTQSNKYKRVLKGSGTGKYTVEFNYI